MHGQLTEKADIYSYGILVLEIVTGRKNNNSVDDSPEGQSLMSQVTFYSYLGFGFAGSSTACNNCLYGAYSFSMQ